MMMMMMMMSISSYLLSHPYPHDDQCFQRENVREGLDFTTDAQVPGGEPSICSLQISFVTLQAFASIVRSSPEGVTALMRDGYLEEGSKPLDFGELPTPVLALLREVHP